MAVHIIIYSAASQSLHVLLLITLRQHPCQSDKKNCYSFDDSGCQEAVHTLLWSAMLLSSVHRAVK